jgi:hypothetical protein
MPTFTGSSSIGWQFLGQGGQSERLLLLQVAGVALPPTRKIGYMAVYQLPSFGTPPLLPVFVSGASIWSNGAFFNQPLPLLPMRNEAWVLWRESGLTWTFTTRQ